MDSNFKLSPNASPSSVDVDMHNVDCTIIRYIIRYIIRFSVFRWLFIYVLFCILLSHLEYALKLTKFKRRNFKCLQFKCRVKFSFKTVNIKHNLKFLLSTNSLLSVTIKGNGQLKKRSSKKFWTSSKICTVCKGLDEFRNL